MVLKKNDLEMILHTVSNIQGDRIDFRNSVLKLLSEVYGYQHLTFFLCDEKGFFYNPTVINMNSTLMNDYEKYYFQTDIFHIINSQQRLANHNVLSINSLMSYKEYEKTEFYNDLLKKYNLYHELALPLKLNNRLLGCIGILRSKEEGVFTQKDVSVLNILNKHISSNLNIHLGTLQLQYEKQIVQDSIHKLPLGVIIFDNKFSLLFINETAQNFCYALAGDIFVSDSLSGIVKMLLSKLPLQPLLNSSHLQVSIGFYTVEVVPFIAPSLINTVTTYYTIYMTKNQTPPASSLDTFSTMNDLTERETEIVRLILDGLNNAEIGKRLFISPNTVKTHLLNIFKKTRVSRRIELINKINNYFAK